MDTIKEHSFKVLCEHKAKIYEEFNVESLAVFGSVVKGTATPNSDVDILVRYKETPGLFAFLDLKRYLESLIGRRVDLVTEGAVKKQLRKQIIKEAVRVN